MKILSQLTISLIILIIIGVFTLTPLVKGIKDCAAATITEQMQGSIEDILLPSANKESPEAKALKIIGFLINAFLSLFGVIFLILMVYGGYKWMLASGREDEVKQSKDIIRAAIIGLIIVMMAYAITWFVASSLQSSIAK